MRRLSIVAALLVASGILPAGPKDTASGISSVTMPVHGRIGERKAGAVIDLKGVPAARMKVFLEYTLQKDSWTNPPRYAEARTTDIGGGRIRCEVIFPHRHTARLLANMRTELVIVEPNVRDHNPAVAKPGDRVYCRWAKEWIPNGFTETLTLRGDVHEFEMPRRLTIANLGDSYSCGEGAPSGRGSKWLLDACHRSKVGGQHLAIREFIDKRPDLAIDYLNVGCSGAKVGSGFLSGWQGQVPQIEQVREWMERNGHETLDALVLSFGGNDIGFADRRRRRVNHAACGGTRPTHVGSWDRRPAYA